ncbi:hypothetical protein GCM10010388_53410 [Streptomyces mauvecolor]
MFTVGPGDISEYGTLMSTPAQSSAISTRVEASIVAVRRGMERQYGTDLCAHPWGRSVRGPLAIAYETGAPRAGRERSDGVGSGVRFRHGFSEPAVPGEFGNIAGCAIAGGPGRPYRRADSSEKRNQQPQECSHSDLPSPMSDRN